MGKLSSRWVLLELALLLVGGAAGWSAGCSGATNSDLGFAGDGGAGSSQKIGTGGSGGVAACTPCLTDTNCGGGLCAQLQGDSFCAPSCAGGEGATSCPSGTTCSIATDVNGAQVSVCAPTVTCPGGTGPASGPGSGAGTVDSGTPACVPASSNCDGYDAPTTPSSCDSCTGSSSSPCQANGCYGGWYCDTATSKCHEAPSGCSSTGTTCPGGTGTGSSGTGTGATTGSGSGTSPTTVTGTVTASGGTVSSLLFAVVGDTRPANIDDTSGYPTTIIDTIFADVTARSPQPSFVVSTGDYQYSSAPPTSGASTSAPQLALYMQARAKFPGPQFPAMGNHECNGYTASNCGSGNTDGVTENYSNFLSTMLGPINQTNPYYAIKVSATDGSWTSKLVFIAANAWDSAQSSWLDTTLAESTTYTFVIRHEATEANTAPGVSPSDTIIAKYPLTLEICGHTHDYSKSGNKIVMGNGGAPLTGSGDYGYGLITQRSDGNIIVDEVDYQTNAADSSFHFVVTPTGTLTE